MLITVRISLHTKKRFKYPESEMQVRKQINWPACPATGDWLRVGRLEDGSVYGRSFRVDHVVFDTSGEVVVYVQEEELGKIGGRERVRDALLRDGFSLVTDTRPIAAEPAH
jgi:hypothetical protein